MVYGTLDLPSGVNIAQLQPRLKFFEKYNNVPDTLRHTESVGSNGIFSVTPTEVDTDTDYRIYLSLGGPNGDSIPSILNTAITVSDFTAAETEFSWQSLTTGNFVDTLFYKGCPLYGPLMLMILEDLILATRELYLLKLLGLKQLR